MAAYSALVFTGLGIYLAKNGEPRDGTYSFFLGAVTVLLEVPLLLRGWGVI